MSTSPYEPKGIRFWDQASNREMLLVTEVCGWTGWLCFRHPDGQWVSLREATEDDRARISQQRVKQFEEGGVVMIDYSKTRRGDILKIVGAGAPGYAQLGDLVRVVEVRANCVEVEDKNGEKVDFVYNCGAARLEPTEWRDDFPAETGNEAPCSPA